MSRNLTQPEEIDLILMSMARHELEGDMPVSVEAPLSSPGRETEGDELATEAVYSYRVVCPKSTHGLPNPQLHVRRV